MSSNCISWESRYAIRRTDLVKAVAGHLFVQVEEIIHNYNYYLGTTKGLAQVSASGKALNIDIFNEGSFTVSLNTLRNVLHGRERQACIVKIPGADPPIIKDAKDLHRPEENICNGIAVAGKKTNLYISYNINSPSTDDPEERRHLFFLKNQRCLFNYL